MGELIALFFIGVGTGMFAHSFIVTQTIGKIPTTICDYCEYKRERMRMKEK